jgi:hypothetical protein
MGLRTDGHLKFKQQVIIEYLVSNNDHVITEGTDNIIIRCQQKGIHTRRVQMKFGVSHVEENFRRIRETANWIKGPFRVYLRGHGDWQQRTLGGRKAEIVVGHVHFLGKMTECQLISITGCELALSQRANGSGESTQSFAKEFHSGLSSGGQNEALKRIPVFARTQCVTVNDLGIDRLSRESNAENPLVPVSPVGAKSSGDAKKVFYWHGNRQMVADAAFADMVVKGLPADADLGEEI